MKRDLIGWALLALVFLCFALSYACVWLNVAVALAAPVPKVKPAPAPAAPSLVGTWESRWGGWGCEMILAADGGYRHRYCGTTYFGTWAVAGDGSLVVTEQSVSAGGNLSVRHVWTVPAAWDAGAKEWGGDVTGDYGRWRWGLRKK